MRWRIHLSFLGTRYAGWQRQPGDMSVQQRLEEAFSMILRQPVALTGCGRTDAGVHARHYVAHMDAEGDWSPERIAYQVNAVLPPDIAVAELLPASSSFHARFDAVSRCYRYYIHFRKDPFREGRSMYFQQPALLDRSRMAAATSVLLEYDQFRPFCKTGADEKHFRCAMLESHWTFDADGAVYTVRANRFLRGMVRLIVGTGLNAGLGKLTPEDVRLALDNQSAIPQAWSVPAEGLYLEDITYPE